MVLKLDDLALNAGDLITVTHEMGDELDRSYELEISSICFVVKSDLRHAKFTIEGRILDEGGEKL